MLRLAILAIAPMLTATGCLLPPDNDVLQFEDDFEACDLCGWSLNGDVRRVTTYHPAEHAMALAPGARAATSLGIVRNAAESSWESDDGNWVELSTDCVGPGALELIPDGNGRLIVAVTLDDRARAPFARHWLNFPPLDPAVEHQFSMLTLTTETLPCQVDNLQIRISGACMHISLGRAALVLAALTATATADELAPPGTTAPSPLSVADAPPPAPVRGPRLQLALTGDLRLTHLDGAAGRFVDDAMAYGWRIAQARPLYGLGVDAHYLWTPIVDVGARVGYLTQDYAAGVDPADRMGIAWTTVAASARLRWAQGRPFIPEPRLDLGLARQTWTVHGQDDQATRSFVRVGVDWRLGTRTAGVMLAVAYTLTDHPAVDGPAPPVGGLDLAIGPYLRR